MTLKSNKQLSKNELEDQNQLKAKDLPQILAKHPPQYIVSNQEDFYDKARIICENSFNLEMGKGAAN